MRLDTMDDLGTAIRIDSMPSQDSPGQLSAFFRVADEAARPVFFFSSDIMEQGGQFQDLKVGLFSPTDAEAEFINPLGMVPIMAPPGGAEVGFGLLSDRV